MFLRNTGKLCFATIQDGEGRRLQVMLSLAAVGEESLATFKADVDLGDHLFAHGRVISSRRGELSVFADSWQLAAKAIRPLPVLHKELSEESRVRQRYVDLIARPAARDTVRLRAAMMRSLREVLHRRGFLEVETPMLQTIHGGAAARPFVTHMNAFDIELYLRIAPELFLKRAVVGGVERVFEINRNFRNEGADSTHSPEFAMLEAYEAYGDYNTMAALTKDLVQGAANDVLGGTTVTLPDGTEYELGGKWADLSLYGSLSERLGAEVTPQTTLTELERLAAHVDIAIDPARASHGKLVEQLWETLVGAPPRRTHLRPGLPGRDLATDPRPPDHPRIGREMGPVHSRLRAGDRVLGAGRSGDPAGALRGPGAARYRGRRRGDAGRRGLPDRDGVCDAAERRDGDGDRPAAHGADRPRNPRDDPVPAREARALRTT